jgi:FMN reductase
MASGAGETRPVRVAAVYGAATPPGRLAGALDTTVAALGEAAVVTRIDLHATALATAATAAARDDAATLATIEAVAHADAVLIASPVYRASLPGVLKNLLDLLPVDALHAKPVGLVVVGATSHHYLGVDRHVRDVLAWFGALPLPVSVYLSNEDFDDGAVSPGAKAELADLAAALVALARIPRGGLRAPAPLAARHT